MSEFRQNLATKEWVILAPERGKRPHDIAGNVPPRQAEPEHDSNCPFCPGNEHLTTHPIFTVDHDGSWQVRVVPNKFAALSPDLVATRENVGRFLSAQGFGVAEVVIEHPRHNSTMALLSVDEVRNILIAYKQRQVEIAKNDRIHLITVFRNHGSRAGTSLAHPHSQVIATPIVPPHVRYPLELATAHYDMYGRCVYCEMIEEELRQAERIIIETDYFVSFCPFASRSPFECRIYPKTHRAGFVLMSDDEMTDLAVMLREILYRLRTGLNNPDYNYIIRSAPVGEEASRHLHWYMVIVPKISIPAGFEIGSGIYINTTAPEEAAEFLRNVPERE